MAARCYQAPRSMLRHCLIRDDTREAPLSRHNSGQMCLIRRTHHQGAHCRTIRNNAVLTETIKGPQLSGHHQRRQATWSHQTADHGAYANMEQQRGAPLRYLEKACCATTAGSSLSHMASDDVTADALTARRAAYNAESLTSLPHRGVTLHCVRARYAYQREPNAQGW